MFFDRSEDLSQARLVPLVLDAIIDLGGTPTRPEIIDRAIQLDRFTRDELAVPSHREQDQEKGRGAVAGSLRYAIWYARTRGDILDGETGGLQHITEQGLARVGEPTGYPELDARRIAVGEPRQAASFESRLRPYAATRTSHLEHQSLREAVPRVYDMDELERRTVDHHQLQKQVVAWLREHGWAVGLSPDPAVMVDMIAERDNRWVVIEVKTLDADKPALARQQLRLGLGQVLDYRERLRPFRTRVDGVVAVSSAPDDPAWLDVMAACGVDLIWAPFGQPTRHLA